MPIPPKLVAYVSHYIEGVLASGFNGGIAALGAIVGPQATNIISGLMNSKVIVPNLTPHQVLGVFIGGFGLKAFTYFQAHPFPIFDPDGDVIPQPPINPTPLAAAAQAAPPKPSSP